VYDLPAHLQTLTKHTLRRKIYYAVYGPEDENWEPIHVHSQWRADHVRGGAARATSEKGGWVVLSTVMTTHPLFNILDSFLRWSYTLILFGESSTRRAQLLCLYIK
jgi:hypothetical protein